ncbi:MAG TPA: class II aldolase/adducin family protein [Kofleriaceae bacterium]|nr:class II aldolase/adducin family protein [Kofleriaceae bacterium]
MRSGQPLRAQVAEVARHLHAAGWVANHDGNVTARDGSRFVATPTATSKRLIETRDLIEVDAKGQVVGSGRVFGEIGLHLAVYERRPDVHAVVHAHPPYATAVSASRGNPIERPFIAEALVSLGPRIPKLPYAQPGDAARAALAPWCELVDAVILGNHGVMAWGRDLEVALLRLELVEHLAKIAVAAAPLGGVEPLPAAAIQPLLAARAKAGIGRAADRAVETAAQLLGDPAAAPLAAAAAAAVQPATSARAPGAVVACAPAPHASVATMSPGGAPHDRAANDLAAIVRDEIVKALRKP